MDVVTYNKTKNYTLQDFEQCTLRQLISIVRQHMKFAVKNLNKKTKTDIASEMYTFHINNKIQVIGEHKEEEKEEETFQTFSENIINKFPNISHYNVDNKWWWCGNEVAKLFGYKDYKNTICKLKCPKITYKKIIQKLKLQSYKNIQPTTIFINENGVCKLLCTSKKTNTTDISKQLGINVYNHKYECKETESITMILKTFKGEKMEQQYRVGTYRIDLYFIEYNLCIECDEYNHMDRDTVYETERYNYISTMLNCKWIRYNPDDKNFNIFSILNEIFIIIKNNTQH